MPNHDWTLMYAMHNALRRELEHLAKLAAREDDDPRRILAGAPGWELFTKALHAHHTAEDETLWPVMRDALAGRPDDLALLDAMEAEHAAIDPVIEAIDTGNEPLGDLVGALTEGLTAHLRHEEDKALPLMDEVVTAEQLARFGQAHATKIGPDASRILPWMLDGAAPATVAAALAPLPPPARAAFENEWRPAYEALNRWNTP
ncbi:hemerythrin domain-containing protein [Actinomadura spongiicola]|uniref:Hemerythrin domain-containing protein n=1 Tax=Actinomadura spongiicola TaxID=2303421 RepID=A0A372G8V0_9ACTN|nr:hemerythrin domain-containing protein [Actinomadura spongiicola]RFS81815.1 hemerythrin domain-containing protein [Actinomadura spongiicola]